MKGPHHPFNDSLKLILSKLEQIIKNQKIKTKENPKYVLLDNADILQLFKISKETASNWRAEGILPFLQIKGKIYYSLLDIHKLIDKSYNPVKKKVMHRSLI
jgi:hypothetical protein